MKSHAARLGAVLFLTRIVYVAFAAWIMQSFYLSFFAAGNELTRESFELMSDEVRLVEKTESCLWLILAVSAVLLPLHALATLAYWCGHPWARLVKREWAESRQMQQLNHT